MMLRAIAIAVAAVLFAIVAALCAAGVPLYGPLVLLAILLIGLIYERHRYKPLAARPPAGWQATGERFIDPETQEEVEVWTDPATGERSYVAKGQAPGR